MKEVHEQVKQNLTKNTQKIKYRVHMKERNIRYHVGDLVMVHLNKARLPKGVPSKLQMSRPCKILEKYENNAYNIYLPKDIALSPTFNVTGMIPFKGPNQ